MARYRRPPHMIATARPLPPLVRRSWPPYLPAMAKRPSTTKSRKDLTLLGRPAPLPASPAEAQLETFANPHPGTAYVVRFTCPEFTSMCPITGQPDFAHLVIDY